MDRLNYHHLRLFREVANEGNLTRAAKRVGLSQSALSSQIRTLEQRLGHNLFDRKGRSLKLTEVGAIVLDHADRIFGTGRELLATLEGSASEMRALRVGAVSTLSRNFQMEFPWLGSIAIASFAWFFISFWGGILVMLWARLMKIF
ncbi:MAG: LysR family transcriptional regulator, partial [Pseudomonadota bacterium]